MASPRDVVLLAWAAVAVGIVVQDDTRVEVSAQGNTVFGQHFGSFIVFNSTYGHGDAYALEFQLIEVNEVSLSNDKLNREDVIGEGNTNAHSFTWSASDFPRPFTSPRSSVSSIYDLNVSSLALNKLAGKGNEVEFQAFIIEKAGTAGPGTSAREVSVGDVYLRVDVKVWNFCGSCVLEVCQCLWSEATENPAGYIGANLDLKFLITAYSPARELVNGEFALGGGVTAAALKDLTVDGVATPQPANYPLLQDLGEQRVLTLRVPKFTSTAQADVVLHLNWLDDSPPWTFLDMALLFGYPILVLVGVIGFLSLCCRPKAEKAGYMDKKLKQARQRRAAEQRKQHEKELQKRDEEELQESTRPHGRAAPLLTTDRSGQLHHGQPHGPPSSGSGPLAPHDSLERGEGRRPPGAGSKLGLPPKPKSRLDL